MEIKTGNNNIHAEITDERRVEFNTLSNAKGKKYKDRRVFHFNPVIATQLEPKGRITCSGQTEAWKRPLSQKRDTSGDGECYDPHPRIPTEQIQRQQHLHHLHHLQHLTMD